jgi:hypothetical protein
MSQPLHHLHAPFRPALRRNRWPLQPASSAMATAPLMPVRLVVLFRHVWSLHTMVRGSFRRPSSAHGSQSFFPVDSRAPQLIWIKCDRRVDDEDGMAWESPDTRRLLETENLDPRYQHAREFKSIMRNVLRGYNLSHTVQVICRETFLIDGSTSNGCVRHATNELTHDWRGPVVGMRRPGTAIDPLFYEDVSAGDFRVVVDYFLSYGRV